LKSSFLERYIRLCWLNTPVLVTIICIIFWNMQVQHPLRSIISSETHLN
jgi:hypothetical protein